jgi:hypothetical protein
MRTFCSSALICLAVAPTLMAADPVPETERVNSIETFIEPIYNSDPSCSSPYSGADFLCKPGPHPWTAPKSRAHRLTVGNSAPLTPAHGPRPVSHRKPASLGLRLENRKERGFPQGLQPSLISIMQLIPFLFLPPAC